MPNSFEVTCSAPPSMFAYPKLEEKKEGNILLNRIHFILFNEHFYR